MAKEAYDRQHQSAEIEALRDMLAAQSAGPPYGGWNLSRLNKAADAARGLLGLPSIRDLNPDIARMQDHAAANWDAILDIAQRHADTEIDALRAENARLREAVAKCGDQFEFYAKEHAEKVAVAKEKWDAARYYDDADEPEKRAEFQKRAKKVATNQEFVELCCAALEGGVASATGYPSAG